MKTETKKSCGQESAKIDLRNLERVRAIFSSLSKFINAKTIYTSNNPHVTNFANAFFQAFQTFFEDEKNLLLTIEQYQIKWRGEVVYDNNNKTQSIAFLLYKDGVGEIIFDSSAKTTELEQFVDLIKNEIYNPATHLDIVSRLWESQFTNIFYRVYDESADGTSGEGRGSGNESREQPLLANDHPDLPDADENNANNTARADNSIDSLGTYFYHKAEQKHPHADAHQKEEHVQNMLEGYFTVSSEKLRLWQDKFFELNGKNKLLWLFKTMLDFTQTSSTPSVIRDILDIIERLVRDIIDEADIPTLIALLDIERKMAQSHTIAFDFHSLPDRIEHELTNKAFLRSLGKTGNMPRYDAREILQFFRLIGNDAVPGVCELLANAKDSSIHKEACDTLLAIAGDDIMKIIEDLNLYNPYEAKCAVYLLRQSMTNEVPPIIERLMDSPNVQVQENVIEYLVHVGSEEAALLLCKLLEADDMSVRIKTFAAVEEFRHSLIIDKVTSLCFAEDIETKSTDELERMFRAVGKLAGEKVLVPLEQMIKKKKWLLFSNSQNKQKKLLVITALRYIPGLESLKMLRKLADDGNSLVKTKAQYALRQLDESVEVSEEEQDLVGSEEVKR